MLSGGLDSTTVLYIATNNGFSCYCISFEYGQKHSIELEFARRIAANHEGVVAHKILSLGSIGFEGSSLTGFGNVPKSGDVSHLSSGKIPSTYVPMRNTIFISYAIGYAELIGASSVFVGCNAVDYSNYPDCRPKYIEAFQKLSDFATGCKVSIKAPLINMSKSEIIKVGIGLGINYSSTFSCYDPIASNLPCGKCDACILRRNGFESAGYTDKPN